MGSAQGEESAKEDPLVTGRPGAVVRFSDVAATLDAHSLHRRVSESRAKRFVETSLKRDFPEAHLRMNGIGQKNLGCEGLNPLSPIECGRLEVWYYRLRIRKEMFYLS